MEIKQNYDRTTREVRLEITGATEPMPCGTSNQPRRFLPETMVLEWRNGKLDTVGVSGHRILKDGTRSVMLDGITVYLHGSDRTRLPDWVRDLVALMEANDGPLPDGTVFELTRDGVAVLA